MQEVKRLLERLAPTDVTVTILGETGTGKDVIARQIHQLSPRASGPFTVFDCGAIAPNLAESELLGHERGSFTGAVASHVGAAERAHGGTLFLDEIGELPLDLQPRLLRMLENRQVRRVGGSESRPVDVRVVAATNRDLREEVAAGRFREDLYFRLAGAVVWLPPLRERSEDLRRLVSSLMVDLGAAQQYRFSEPALRKLEAHSWPGNIRELRNVLSCALAFSDTDLIGPEVLQLRELSFSKEDSLARLPLGGQTLAEIERAAVEQTLRHTAGNKARAAELLGIAVSTVYEKIKKYGL